jgi:(p)ppGpp synthase/HD superfamily hydrolase
MTKIAMKLCFEAHKEQTDKSGMPYVFHPFHVAEQMKDEDSTVVALLHDVVEDTDYTLEDLGRMGFNHDVLEAIALLTHAPEVPYVEYLEKIKTNRLAKTVKLADIDHNSDQTRLDPGDERTEYWEKKYKLAREILES